MKFFGDSFNAVCSEIMKDWVLVNFQGLIFVTSLGISYAVFGLNSSSRRFPPASTPSILYPANLASSFVISKPPDPIHVA